MSSRAAVFVLAVLFLLSAGFVATRISDGVDTNILSLLPGDSHDPVLADAMQKASLDASNRVAFAIEGGDARQRGKAAQALTSALAGTGLFRPSSDDAKDLWLWLNSHRVSMLCPADREKLSAGEGAALAQSALIDWFAPVTVAGRDMLASDPLLLTNRLLGCLVPKSIGLAPRGDVAIVSGSLTASVFRLDVQDRVNAVVDQWRSQSGSQGLTLSRAGAVFHAAYGAEHARSEMSIIGGITTVAVLVFYWLMFRSLRAPLIAVSMVVFSLTIGLAAALAIFGSIHAMALVFGAALIGMVVDYTTYFLVTGLSDETATIDERRARIFKPLTLGMVTSVAAFAALLLFPVTAFREIAVFGCVGLVAAWTGTLVLTPRFEGGAMRAGPGALWVRNLAGRYLAQSVSMRSAIMLLLLSLVVVLAGWHRGGTLDDVRRFQAPSPVLASEEARLRSLVGFAPSSRFLLVRGAGRDEATAREEAMLAELGAAGEADAVLWAASRLDPTSATMARDADLIESRLIEPELAQFVKTLGGGNEDAYAGVARKVEADQGTPPGFVSALRGQTGDVYWSIAPVSSAISHVPDMPGVELVEPAGRYSDLLGQYRWLASFGLAGAVVATGLMLLAYYRTLASLRILLPTTVALVVTPAIMVLAGIPFSFFTAMGLFLVAGAGVDYAIFQWEKPGAEGVWTRVGIVLAASMTCISVGLLGLSSVLPVRSFGLTVAIGVVISLLFSPLVRGWSGDKIPGGGS